MRIGKTPLLALLIGLVLTSVAGASTLTLTLQIAGSMPSPGEEFTVEVYALAEGTTGGYGIRSLGWTISTPGTVGLAAPVTVMGGGFPPKLLVKQDWPIPGMTNFPAEPTDVDGDTDTDAGPAAWADAMGGNTNYFIGIGAAELVATQTWLYTSGEVTLGVVADPDSAVYDMTEADYTREFDEIIVQGVTFGGGGNNAPAITSTGGPYLREQWSGVGPWNNPAHEIDLLAAATDDIDDPADLTYEWLISEPSPDPGDPSTGTFFPLAEGMDPMITIQMIADAVFGPGSDPFVVLPAWEEGLDPEIFDYELKLVVTDSGMLTDEAYTTIFVPEPATLALLAFGGLAALRRRRRA